jgi:hypothetical protein
MKIFQKRFLPADRGQKEQAQISDTPAGAVSDLAAMIQSIKKESLQQMRLHY